ncbi:diguanylate cyclase [Anaerotignum sp.]|uniref:sensor domain-containing diguanylate cyclase n=1 Tax=Anaerotignum sp. TaxID=2039241 RepID=UPI003327DBB3
MDKLKSSIRRLEALILSLDNKLDTNHDILELIKDCKNEISRKEQEGLELKNQLKNANKKQEFYLTALNALPNPIFMKNSRAEFIFFNEAYQKYFNMNPEDYLNRTVYSLDYLPLNEREKYHKEDTKLIQTGLVQYHEKCFQLSDKNHGDALYWSKGFMTEQTKIQGLIGEIVDISTQTNLKNELKKNIDKLELANKQIHEMARLDYLTNIYNRRVLGELVQKVVGSNENKKQPVYFLLADLDHFKLVNDNFGHSMGDKILVRFSELLKEACGDKDMIIRYGGEEFLIILLDTDELSAVKVAERIRSCAEKELLLPNHCSITVSIGITEHKTAEGIDSCLYRVDSALYQAKENGRNQIVVC